MKEYEITKEFEQIVDEASEGQSLISYLKEVRDYGQEYFIYYHETTDLYDKYASDCDDWASDLGMKPWDLFGDWDLSINSEQNKWLIVTAMFEQYCIDRLDELED